MDEKFTGIIGQILKEDSRYAEDSYEFVNDAVSYTVRKLEREKNPKGTRHVSGQELVQGTAEYAVKQFGPVACEVLTEWNVTSGLDVGNIVYNMIAKGILSASPEDSKSDFDCFPDLIGDIRRTLRRKTALSSQPPCIE